VTRLDLSGEDQKFEKVAATGDLPPRQKHQIVVAVDEELFVFVKNDEDMLDLYIFDTVTNAWTFGEVAGELPQAVQNPTVTLVEVDGKPKIVLFGGTLFAENLLLRSHSNSVDVLDVDTLTWNTTATSGEVPSGRSQHAAVATGPGKLVVTGGKNEMISFRDILQLEVGSGGT
jgi:N-acetylneuraminic acid mutarotase